MRTTMLKRLGCGAVIGALVACSEDGSQRSITGPVTAAPAAGVARVTMVGPSDPLTVGAKVKLEVKATTAAGTPAECRATFASSDAAIASVASDGEVTAKAEGVADIRATCVGGLSAIVRITVKAQVSGLPGTPEVPEVPGTPEVPEVPELPIPLPADLIVTPELATLQIGAKVKLVITAKTIDGMLCDCQPTYVSSNPAIAVVSSDGEVTAKAEGITNIKVTCVGGVSVTVKITVTAQLPELPTDTPTIPEVPELPIDTPTIPTLPSLPLP